jgi:hypothetical protein
MKNILFLGACLAMSLSASACVTTSVSAKVTIVDDVGIELAVFERQFETIVISNPFVLEEGHTFIEAAGIGSGYEFEDTSIMCAYCDVNWLDFRIKRWSYYLPLTIGKADSIAKLTICKRARDGLTNS